MSADFATLEKMSGDFPSNDRYPSSHAKHVVIAIFISFVIFWLARFATGILESMHRRQQHTVDAAVVDHDMNRSVVRGDGLHRTTDALRDVFISLGITSAIWELLNGIGRGFEIIVWISLIIGVLWAIGKGTTCRFIDLMLVAFIPLVVVLWGVLL